jgi:hypothetical protein
MAGDLSLPIIAVPSKAVPRLGACLLKLSGGAAGEELLKGTPVIAEVLPRWHPVPLPSSMVSPVVQQPLWR